MKQFFVKYYVILFIFQQSLFHYLKINAPRILIHIESYPGVDK